MIEVIKEFQIIDRTTKNLISRVDHVFSRWLAFHSPIDMVHRFAWHPVTKSHGARETFTNQYLVYLTAIFKILRIIVQLITQKFLWRSKQFSIVIHVILKF